MKKMILMTIVSLFAVTFVNANTCFYKGSELKRLMQHNGVQHDVSNGKFVHHGSYSNLIATTRNMPTHTKTLSEVTITFKSLGQDKTAAAQNFKDVAISSTIHDGAVSGSRCFYNVQVADHNRSQCGSQGCQIMIDTKAVK